MIAPAAHSVKDKFDVVEWEKLPNGPCDLNFRPPSGHAGHRWPSALTMGLVASGCVALFAPTTRVVFGPWLTSELSAPVALLVAITLGVFSALGWYQPIPTIRGMWNSLTSAMLSASAVLVAWVCLLLVCMAATTELAVAGLFVLALPLTLLVGDGISTHFVHWTSANPLLDHKTMLVWRDAWATRFTGFVRQSPRERAKTKRNTETHRRHSVVLRQRQSYRAAIIVCILAIIVVPAVALFCQLLDIVDRAETMIVVLLLAAAILLAGWRTLEYPASILLFLPALSSWLFYGQGKRFGPMVFQSPCGLPWLRQSLFVATITLFALILQPLMLADGSFLGLIANSATPITPALFLLLFVSIPLAVPLGFAYFIAVPVLVAHYDALESPRAYEAREAWLSFDGYVDRLINSRNERERRSVLLGYVESMEFPILLPTKLLFEHLHILGASGIAKTSLGLAPLAMQLIRRGDAAVVIIDGKGDQAFFNLARHEAAQGKSRFRWFTNKPRRSTFVFNPFAQQHLQHLSLEEVVGFVTQALNLIHGMDYGRAWFTLLSRVSTKRTFASSDVFVQRTLAQQSGEGLPDGSAPFSIDSFRKLYDSLKTAVQDNKELGNAQHICMAVEMLTTFEQLNLSPSLHPDHPAMKNAIHMPDVLANNEVVYFALMGLMDLASVAEIARLALFSTLLAAQNHFEQTGKRPKVYVLIDEAQVVIGQNLSIVMEQARSYGVSIILSHQNLNQLAPPGGVDLRRVIWECTTNKLIFSARDPETQKLLVTSSGGAPYYDLSWSQAKETVGSGQLGLEYGLVDEEGIVSVGLKTSMGPRLELEDINRVNMDMNLSLVKIERNEDFAQLNGFATCRIDWPMNKDTYDARAERQPWPKTFEGTLSPSGWPQPTADTIVPTTHPQISQSVPDDTIAINKLRKMEHLFFDEENEQ